MTLSSPSIPAADFSAERRIMVDCQIRTFDVTDQAVISRTLATPRELFLPERLASVAYSDKALVVGEAEGGKRRLLPPMLLARLLQALTIKPQDKALDVAGGGGYGAALIAGLAASTLAVESEEEFTARARAGFAQLGLSNAEAVTGPLARTGQAKGPFDVILVNGAVEDGLEPLLALLADGGRLAAILKAPGDSSGMAGTATLWERSGGDIGMRALLNAGAPLLPAFARKKAFAF